MENYTHISTHDQQLSGLPESYQPGQLLLNSSLPNFIQLAPAVDDVTLTRTKDKVKESVCGVTLVESGITHDSNNSIPQVCPECGASIHKVGTRFSYITHLPLGSRRIMLHVKKHRYHCKSCGFNITEDIPYQMDDHKVTTQMHTYICDLLSMGFNLTEVKYITKVGINIIKDIDKKRLEKLYTQCNENGERTLTPPTEYSQYLGIDEFLLHEGRHYATVIMDLMTGHVLYLQRTKKKDVVYQFMNWVGDDWMKHVEAVACDMNADFSKAFQERYPEIKVVYDYFHIKKNFLDKVINAIRKDEIRRLTEEGRNEEPASLKGCKYILLANRTTLQRNDGTVGDVTERASSMFGSTPAKQKRNLEEVYDRIIQENRLIMTADYVKEMLDYSFSCTDRKLMSRAIGQIIAVCYATRNKHFKWFGNLLKNHRDGILTHAELKLSSGKVEGTNRKIKTIRWKAYGFKDDDYFFLKIIDSTRA